MIGKGKTVANGKVLQKGCEYILQNCTVLEIIAGKHYYVVRFKEERAKKPMRKPYKPKIAQKKNVKQKKRGQFYLCQKCRDEFMKARKL